MQVNLDALYGQPNFQKLQSDISHITGDTAPSSKPMADQANYNPYQSANVVSESRSISSLAISYAKQGEDSVQAVKISSESIGTNINTKA